MNPQLSFQSLPRRSRRSPVRALALSTEVCLRTLHSRHQRPALQPRDLRPSAPRPEDPRPEGGESPRGRRPRGESPRGRKSKGRCPNNLGLAYALNWDNGFHTIVRIGPFCPRQRRFKDLRPIDLRPSAPRPEDPRPEGGRSPRGRRPRGESPRGKKPKGRCPSNLCLVCALHWYNGFHTIVSIGQFCHRQRRFENLRPRDLRPSDPRPEDPRPEGGRSPRGRKPRGESPRGRKPKRRRPSNLCLVCALHWYKGFYTIVRVGQFCNEEKSLEYV